MFTPQTDRERALCRALSAANDAASFYNDLASRHDCLSYASEEEQAEEEEIDNELTEAMRALEDYLTE